MKNIHAIGDRANSVVLDALEYGINEVVNNSGSHDSRARIEHAQIIRPEDTTRLARLSGNTLPFTCFNGTFRLTSPQLSPLFSPHICEYHLRIFAQNSGSK